MTEPYPPLTPQECRVVNFMVEGLSYRRIAAKMNITQGTVRWHVSNIADKLPREDGMPAFQTVFLWAVESRKRGKAA